MSRRWMEHADYVTDGDWRILGETEAGILVVPVAPGAWRGQFKPWHPMHWRFWLRSRLTKRIAFLEVPR